MFSFAVTSHLKHFKVPCSHFKIPAHLFDISKALLKISRDKPTSQNCSRFLSICLLSLRLSGVAALLTVVPAPAAPTLLSDTSVQPGDLGSQTILYSCWHKECSFFFFFFFFIGGVTYEGAKDKSLMY